MLVIVIAGAMFILAHEGGHYLAAASFGLDPQVALEGPSTALAGFSVGVTHMPTTALQDTIIVMGAYVLPLSLALGFILLYSWKKREEFWLLAAILIILVAVTLMPIPGAYQVDANRIFSILLGF